MSLSPLALLALSAALAVLCWLLAAARPRPATSSLAIAASALVAVLLTWRVVALNRAALALPADALTPALDGWPAILLTFAWAVAAVQIVTLGLTRAPLARLPVALAILALVGWPSSWPFAALARDIRVYGADSRAVLLLGLALAAATFALSGSLALLVAGRQAPLSWRAHPAAWLCLVVGATGAALALGLLARRIDLVQGQWRPAVSWLAALAGMHLLAAGSAVARRAASPVPGWVMLVAYSGLLLYLALASAGRIAGA